MTATDPDAAPDPAPDSGTAPAFLRALFDAAVAAADPMRIVPAHLPPRPSGRVVVVGAGKASARMAEAVERVWGPCDGLVITRDGYGRPTRGIEIALAAHPVPDQRGVEATARMLALLRGLGRDDQVLALISGGASALLCAPGPGLSLAQKQRVNAALLASGLPIGQMNRLRKHLSAVKGGQLAAAAAPAALLCLMISDVPGDDPAMIGSGPTVGESGGESGDDDTAPALAALLDRLDLPPDIARAAHGALAHSGVVRAGDGRLARVTNRVIAAPAQSLAAAAALARARGCAVEICGDAIEGEARDIARAHAARIAAIPRGGTPRLILSGGELTVTRRGNGIGGPNAEYALALALALDGAAGVHALACDTDGVDGAAEIAGALIGPDTLARARACGVDARDALARNDAHGFFGRVGGQVVTGPTLTNVNDFRAVLILPRR